VVALHFRVRPADELTPGEPLIGVLVRAVLEVRRGVDRDAVRIERLDMVIVVGDQDLECRVVVDVAECRRSGRSSVTGVPLPVAVGVVALAGGGVVPRPGLPADARGLVQRAVRPVHEDLRPAAFVDAVCVVVATISIWPS
jgi:hypothetical protein